MVQRKGPLTIPDLYDLATRHRLDQEPDWPESHRIQTIWAKRALLWTRVKLACSTLFLMVGLVAGLMAFALPLRFESWVVWLICLLVFISTSMNLADIRGQWQAVAQVKRDLSKLRQVKELYNRRLKLVI